MPTNLYGQQVYVYRNLHKKCLSLMQAGKVVAHVQQAFLTDVEYRVRQGGYERAVDEKRRNVHAFAIGTLVDGLMVVPTAGFGLHYDYRKGPYFRCGDKAIARSRAAIVSDTQLIAYDPLWSFHEPN